MTPGQEAAERHEGAKESESSPAAAGALGTGRPRIRRIGRRRVVSSGPSSDASSAPERDVAAQSADDTDAGWADTAAGPHAGTAHDDDARARWLRAERPPHWW